MAKELTPRQERFCREYIIDLNATQAAIRAGYAAKDADVQGPRLLGYVGIQAKLQELKDQQAERLKISADYVLKNLQEVAERCMQRAPVMVRQGKHMVQAIDDEGRHVWKFDSMGANTALGLLGKHFKLFTDKVEHSGTVNIADEIRAARERAKPRS